MPSVLRVKLARRMRTARQNEACIISDAFTARSVPGCPEQTECCQARPARYRKKASVPQLAYGMHAIHNVAAVGESQTAGVERR